MLDDNHALTAREYADITARDADSDFNTDSDNLNKVVRVESPLPKDFERVLKQLRKVRRPL